MQNEIYFGRDLISESDLQHFGIPKRSGRYPWGSGEDPYHHGADAPGGKKSSKSDGPKESFFKRRAAKKAAVAKAKQEKIDREAKEERERQKQEALKSGDPTKLAPFVNDLSDDELKRASERLKLQNEFADKMATASKYKKSTADKVNATVEKMTTYANTGINAWNVYAKLHNAFGDPKDSSFRELPVIGSTTRKSIRDDELKKIEDAYEKARKRAIEDETRQDKRMERAMQLEEKRLALMEKRAQLEQKPSSGGQVIDNQTKGGGKKHKENSEPWEVVEETKPAETKKPTEEELRKRWADEANEIADRGKEARRSEEVREMANEYAKQIALQEEAARRKSFLDDSNETANRGAEAKRSEEVRELANEYAKQIALQEEAARRKSLTDDFNETANRGLEARRSEEVRELANEYARQIALQEEAARRKSWLEEQEELEEKARRRRI